MKTKSVNNKKPVVVSEQQSKQPLKLPSTHNLDVSTEKKPEAHSEPKSLFESDCLYEEPKGDLMPGFSLAKKYGNQFLVMYQDGRLNRRLAHKEAMLFALQQTHLDIK